MNIPVIEVNNNPCIEEGYTLNVTEKSETSLDAMFEELYRLESGGGAATGQKPKLLAP